MKLNTSTIVLAASALVLAGCETPEGNPDYTGSGALIGGASGAAIGSIADRANPGAGALIGAAAGLIAGGLIGHDMDQQEQARLRAQAPQTYARVEQGQPLAVADIKAMARAGVSDDVIISQIRASHTVYHLSAAEIIDLHDTGVSQKVIDFMINTPGAVGPAPQANTVVVEAPPPTPPLETVVMAPGPGYIWVGGEWIWRGGWVWVGGHWCVPPYPHAVWVRGYWGRRGPHGYWVGGHWR